MRALWDEPAPGFDGRFVSFSNVIQRPRPTQRPHPPIVIGGESPAAYRRARSSTGWYGWEQTPEQVVAVRERLGAEVEITITPSPPGPLDPELARSYADAGVERLVLQPPNTTGAAMDDLIKASRETLIGHV
jgi:alkanesulfonate monooxygenase SsuD/methylene tetrahydromethanopterin reductase-like flavin-dependent oxidoreductase (luciferase family)